MEQVAPPTSSTRTVALMGLMHHCYELGWTATLGHNFPNSTMTDLSNALGRPKNGRAKDQFPFIAILLRMLIIEASKNR